MIPLSKIHEICSRKPTDVAVISSKREATWSDLTKQVESCLDGLIKNHQGQFIKRACFVAENCEELVVLMSVMSTLRITVIGIDHTSDIAQIAHCIKEVGADCLIYSQSMSGILAQLRAMGVTTNLPILLDGDDGHGIPFASLCSGSRTGRLPATDIPDRSFESISFTSGTTGYPKAVRRTKPFDARRFAYMTERYRFTDHDRFMVTLPFYHVSSTGWARLFLSLGASIVIGDYLNTHRLIRQCALHSCTTTLMVPPVLDRAIRAMLDQNINLDRLRFILVGGKNFPIDMKTKALECFGPILHEYYGSTETGVNVLASSEDMHRYAGSVGKAFDGNKLAIVSDSRHPAQPGEIGRIAIHSYQNMDGYLNADHDSVVIDGDEYILMPDIGYLNREGYLFVLSRVTRDAAHANGVFDQYAMENSIRATADVDDVTILPTQPISGLPAAACVVVPTSGADIGALKSMVAEHFQRHQVTLADVVLLDSIPYSLSGKVKLREINRALELV